MTSTALKIFLSLLMLTMAVSALPKRYGRQAYGGEVQLSGGNTRYQCVEMPLSNICDDHFGTEGWYARFPNSRGLTRDQAIRDIYDFLDLLHQDNYCSHMFFALLCFHYFPMCSLSHPEVAAMPCREVCEEVSAACLPIGYALHGDDFNFPQHLNCTNFDSMEPGVAKSADANCSPASNGSSGSESSECSAAQILACPNATIHVDFCPPIGQVEYVVLESEGYLEVCLTLSNVGYYSSRMTLSTNVIVQLSTTTTEWTYLSLASEGKDYKNVFATVVFPVGSRKHDKQCVNVSIINDGLIEQRESFSMAANILSPSTANIGGAAKSSSRSIEVILVDNDAPADISEKCKENCNIRSRLNGATFKRNCYTFVAHVEAIGRRDYDDYSLLDVHIITCWSLGACGVNGTTYSITICLNCEPTFTSGRDYVIAGVNDSNGRLLVGNVKEEGLVGTWWSRYSRFISHWVQDGIDFHENNPENCS